jgi:hypothetical protein
MLKYHIQTIDLVSTQETILFSNIPQDYSDLYILCSLRENGTDSARAFSLFINGQNVTTARVLVGNGSAASSNTAYVAVTDSATATANTFANVSFYISNYASNNTKSISTDFVTENNATTAFQGIGASSSPTTAPITSFTIFGNSASWVAGTSVSLYGVRRRSDGRTEVASGGVISTNGGYTIHTFNTSGTFVANRNLNVEYLVIAGGGGGSNTYGGFAGGGAGGYRSSVIGESSGGGSQAEALMSLSAGTSHMVTIGAGGIGATAVGSVVATNGINSSFGSIISNGGGYSGNDTNGNTGGAGGSGGGGGANSSVGAAGGIGTTNQGFNGGTGRAGTNGVRAGAGGGGSGGIGSNGANGAGGNGGAGLSSTINGSSTPRGGGGGGGTLNGTIMGAATAGGGSGVSNSNGANGTANTGGGGGGADFQGAGDRAGGNGGSGVVIIRYLTP